MSKVRNDVRADARNGGPARPRTRGRAAPCARGRAGALACRLTSASATFTGGLALAVALAVALAPSTAAAVNWEQQAERLQRISATLLDGLPIPTPPTAKYGLGVVFDTSLLPKPNAQVGAKKEKVPAAPAHAVPTVKGYGLFDLGKNKKAGVNAYAGYLVPGLEGIFGVKAKLSQYAAGAAGHFALALSPATAITVDAGLHHTGGSLTGAITAPSAKDEFTFSTTAFYLAPGVALPKSGIFANVMLGHRSSESELKIPADETDLKTEDSLQDAPVPMFVQFAAGWTHKATGSSLGLAYLVVPARLYMPRLHLSLLYPLGAPSAATAPGSAGQKARAGGAGSRGAPGASTAPGNKKPPAGAPKPRPRTRKAPNPPSAELPSGATEGEFPL